MQKIFLILYSLLVLLMSTRPAAAQNGKPADKEIARTVFASMRQLNAFSYHYDLRMVYPNGDKDGFAGDVYCDLEHGRMLNKSAASTLLLTNEWYLSALHEQKSLTIYNLPKMLAAEKKKPEDLVKDMRQLMQYGFPDSALMSKGTLSSVTSNGALVHLEIAFPERMQLRKLVIDYNKESRQLQYVRISAFYPYSSAMGDQQLFRGKGTLQEITCSQYRQKVPAEVFATAPYFKVGQGNKLTTLQYRQYQLKTNL